MVQNRVNMAGTVQEIAAHTPVTARMERLVSTVKQVGHPGGRGGTPLVKLCCMGRLQCGAEPCQHGRNCTGDSSSYTCHCLYGTTGVNCETSRSPRRGLRGVLP